MLAKRYCLPAGKPRGKDAKRAFVLLAKIWSDEK